MTAKIDEKKIEEVLNRGVENIYPGRDFLEKKLREGKPLKIYLGIDPTGPTLHLGHTISLLKLRQFQELGHKIILLIGDFTATIGDPTDKMSARKPLTIEETRANAELYKKQASAILDFSGGNKAELRYNSEWLGKLNLADMLKLLSSLTYAQTIKRDMFQKRIAENKDLYLNEFMYPAMQGYDSVAMDVDGEVGGNDQTFNMLVGRDLLKKIKDKEKFVIANKLLTSGGKKMGKTEGNMVSLNQNENEMFGAVMSWSDDMIMPAFELCTWLPMEEVAKIGEEMKGGANPKDIKMRLAKEIVEIYHGKEKAEKAEENFENTFEKGGAPEEMAEVKAKKGELLSDALVAGKIVSSKSDFKRLVGEGAVGEIETGEKISDFNFKVEKPAKYRVGKRRFVKIIVE